MHQDHAAFGHPDWALLSVDRLDEMRSAFQVFAWGLNTSGQLGLNDVLVRKSPAVVDALWAMPVQQLAAGKPSLVLSLSCTCIAVARFCQSGRA